MTVYVDSGRFEHGRMIMSHMIADSTEELLAMADRIGVARKWLQHPSTYKEHFDVCQSKRAIAIRHGARPITLRDLGRMLGKRRRAAAVPQ